MSRVIHTSGNLDRKNPDWRTLFWVLEVPGRYYSKPIRRTARLAVDLAMAEADPT